MNGQLWQECYCGTEPVCASCEKCKKHCTCGKPADRAASITGELMARPQYKYIDGAVLADVVRDTLTLYNTEL